MDEITSLLEPQIPGLRRYAFALVGDHAGADDLVQDCLERAVSRWWLRRRDADLRAWLFSILRNIHIDGYRQHRRRGQHVELDDTTHASVSATQDAGLGARDVLSAIDQLPEGHKSILLLVGVEELTYEQTARVLDIPIGTVMSRLSRARQRLRSIMESGGATVLRRVK